MAGGGKKGNGVTSFFDTVDGHEVIIVKRPDGYFVFTKTPFPVFIAWGATLEEAKESAREVLEEYNDP